MPQDDPSSSAPLPFGRKRGLSPRLPAMDKCVRLIDLTCQKGTLRNSNRIVLKRLDTQPTR